MSKFYFVDLPCVNCKTKNFGLKVPSGQTLEEFAQKKNQKCRNCNCYLLKIKPNKNKK
ncbi:hypothetical protein LCGC14_0632590 [marine sediment metagenome]|uniref:Uncharacterized protein n=1 Tax=marine sediment metagenome TaxID=412755 RepID=A0A0F9R6R2_9ZZZZ